MEQKKKYAVQIGDLVYNILALDKSFNLKQGNQNYLFYEKHGLGFPGDDPNNGPQNPIEYYKEEEKLIEFVNEVLLPAMYLRPSFCNILRPHMIRFVAEYNEPLVQLLGRKI